jgi:quinoprotein glucose dehydrogenase
MQATKMGFLFVVDRRTGKDVWPIEERKVPGGDGSIQGEVYAPTQPFPTKPAPLLDQSKKPPIWWVADALGLGQCSRMWKSLNYAGMYSPPTHKDNGVLAYPDSAGGVQWGGVAFDPRGQTAIVNFSHVVQSIKLYPRKEYEQRAAGSGNEQGFYPQEGAPYGMSLDNALNWLRMPCWNPPFGEIAAIDMSTGDIKWRRPIGASQKWGFYMPESMGSVTIGGPAVRRRRQHDPYGPGRRPGRRLRAAVVSVRSKAFIVFTVSSDHIALAAANGEQQNGCERTG